MPKSTNPLRTRNPSFPFSTLQRGKAKRSRSSARAPLAKAAGEEDRLHDTGLIPSLAAPNTPEDVLTLIRYIQSHTFADMPDRAAGMDSERISDVLRFRRVLPPVLTVAHLLALSRSSTETERELARLMAAGKVRRLVIPGRGKGGAGVGEGVVVVEDWEARIRGEEPLDAEVRRKYISLMGARPTSPTAPTSPVLSDAEVRQLVSSGFLTSPTALSSSLNDLFAPLPTANSLSGNNNNNNISTSGSRFATGTLAAIGGPCAIQNSGGGGSMLATKSTRPAPANTSTREMTFSLPATGAYLKLLVSARQHLLHLLRQLSPRYKEATVELLREKWDGNTPGDAVSQAKRARGEWTGVLPGKTKKWREFFGLEFMWVLAECVGGGLVELFDTGTVGLAVRGR